MPGLVVGVLAVALVIAGVLSASSDLYAGLIGGMLLMHLGGHGGHGGHRNGTPPPADDLIEPSSATQVERSASAGEVTDVVPTIGSQNKRADDDPHDVRGCH